MPIMNGCQASRLSRKVTCLLLAILLSFFLTGASCRQSGQKTGGTSVGVKVIPGSGSLNWQGAFPPNDEPSELLTRINNYRSSHGLATLTWHHGAASVAQKHSDDM